MSISEVISVEDLVAVGFPYTHKNAYWSLLRKLARNEYMHKGRALSLVDAAAQDFKMRKAFTGFDFLKYYGLDYDPVSLQKAMTLGRVGAADHLLLMDLTKEHRLYPTFDLVFSSNTLTQIPDAYLHKAVLSLYRMLKPGALGVFNVQIDRLDWTKLSALTEFCKMQVFRIHSSPDTVVRGEMSPSDFNLLTVQVELENQASKKLEDCVLLRRFDLSEEAVGYQSLPIEEFPVSNRIIRVGNIRNIKRKQFDRVSSLFHEAFSANPNVIFVLSRGLCLDREFLSLLVQEARNWFSKLQIDNKHLLEIKFTPIDEMQKKLLEGELGNSDYDQIVFLGYEDRFIGQSEIERHLLNETMNLLADSVSISILTMGRLGPYDDLKPSYIAVHR